MSNLYFILEDVSKYLKIQSIDDTQEICDMYGLEVVESLQTDKIPYTLIGRKSVYINLPSGKKKTILNCKIVNEKRFVLSQFKYKLPTNKNYAKIFEEIKNTNELEQETEEIV